MKHLRLIFMYHKHASFLGDELLSKTEKEEEIRFQRAESMPNTCFGYWEQRAAMPTTQDLHFAVQLGDVKKVEKLVEDERVDVNDCFRCMTPLSIAVLQRNEAIVKILLKKGASVNKLSTDWSQRIETPLVSACRLGLPSITRLLIKYRADVNITDFYGHSALWIATRERNTEIVKLLIDNGANLRWISRRWQDCPLYFSTKYMGRLEIAKLLIRHGCDMNISDLEGLCPLYWAITYHSFDVLKLLIIAGVEIPNDVREHLISPKFAADLAAHPEIVVWLHAALKNPLPLKHLAARAVRRALLCHEPKRSLVFPAKKLCLPPSLKEDLMLKFVE